MKNATWDYIHGDTLSWWAADAEATFGEDSHRIAGNLSRTVLDTWLSDFEFPPQTYGANYWTLDSDLPSTVTVTLETGDAESWWLGAATLEAGDHRQSVGLHDSDGHVYLLLEDRAAAEEAWLVVTAIEGSENTGEGYPYRLYVQEGNQIPSGLDDDTEEAAGACACGTALAQASNGMWLIAGVGLIWRRRRTG